MKIWVTGEAGCIAKNLVDYCNVNSNYEVVNRLSNNYFDYWRMAITSSEKEINIFDPSLSRLIQDSGADVIVHTANIDYDLSNKNPHLAIHTHVDGSYTIASIAKKLDLPLMFFIPDRCNTIYSETQSFGYKMIDLVNPIHTSIMLPNLYGKYDTKSFIAKMILSTKGNHTSLPKDITGYREFVHTSEVIQLIDYFLSRNFDINGIDAGLSMTRSTLETIYSSIAESHNFMMDCSFDQDDNIPFPIEDKYNWYSTVIKNRIIMKDAIEDMIKDFEL